MLVMKNIGINFIIYIIIIIIIIYIIILLLRFEILQQSTTVHKQPLIAPRQFETTPAEESIILANLKLFELNGFHFLVKEDNLPGSKLLLTTLPFSRKVQFDENDIHEFASLIENIEYMNGTNNGLSINESTLNQDIPNLVIKNSDISKLSTLKLPKLVSLFASRACRTSVMVGTTLSQSDMNKIVTNLSTIDQPWNCPHGRPTLQYLVDIKNYNLERFKQREKFTSS